ncbi:carboxypeptidase regulatory-like domain-containing protein [Hymenobacter sp. B81]|uniref:carboxypeptidase regulatory-like domain-containing protein n=1 Tax=Hymenobacter sp. B81 TaxID=3344878 RepID=UPI0037DD6AC1
MILPVTRCLWLAVLVLLSAVLTACEEETVEPTTFGAIEGTVRDARSNMPLANVVITTNPATTSFTTDAEGRFALPNLASGKYTLSAKKAEYKVETLSVTVGEGPATAVVVLLDKPVGSNSRPNAPVRAEPANGAGGLATAVTLRWSATDPDVTDSLRYDVVLYESNSTLQRTLLTNSRDTVVLATGLRYGTIYFWQITVRDKAGETTRGDVWSFQTQAFPTLRYVFASTVAGNTDIYASDALAGNVTTLRLTSTAAVETAPQLSPTRDRIAFTSNATGQYQLYTMNRDGSDVRRLTTLAVESYYNQGQGYCWSPDGAQLVYAHYDKLYRINRDGTGLLLLATAPAGRHFREMDWHGLANKIAVQTMGASIYDAEVYLLNPNGTGLTQVLGNQPGRLDSPGFSTDGRQLLYTRDLSGIDDATGRQLNAHILLQNPDGSGLLDLSAQKPAGTNDLWPRFSPDGAKIIFVNQANDNQSPPEVWTMDLDGRNRARLFQNATLPDWK